MKERNFVKSASLLAFSTIIAKFIGACYRIPLANILGGEGMGLYQLVFPVFALLITLSSGAVPSAVAIIVSRKKALNQNSGGVFISSLILITTWGFLLSLLLIILSKHISVLQSTSKIQKSYVMIAPSVFFVSVISVYRGYFIGNQNMTPPAVSQITEAIIKLTAGLALAKKFLKMGLEYAVMAAFLGITVSEIITLIILFILSDNKKSINSGISFAEFKANTKEIASLTFPLMAGGIIIPLSLFFDSLIIINMLNLNQSSVMSTIEYGLFSGAVSPLINLPVMLNLSLGVAVAPSLTAGKICKDIQSIKEKCSTCLKIALAVGTPFLLLFVFLADDLLKLLYPALPPEHIRTAAGLMRIESLNIISLSMGQIITSLLQALGKAFVPVKVLSVCVALKIILNLALLPAMGITGAAIASVACFGIYALCNYLYLNNLIGKSTAMVKNGSKITLCGAIMSTTVFVMNSFLKKSWAIWPSLLSSAVVYALTLLAIGFFDENELKSLPLSAVWIKINKVFRRIRNAIT